MSNNSNLANAARTLAAARKNNMRAGGTGSITQAGRQNLFVEGHVMPDPVNRNETFKNQSGLSSSFTTSAIDGLSGMNATTHPLDTYYDTIADLPNTPVAPYEKGLPGEGLSVTAQSLDAYGKVFLGNRYFDYMEDKKALQFYQEYELWKLSQVDLQRPSVRDWWQKKWPELVKKKTSFMNKYLELEKKRQEIQINGIQGEEDLRFLYLYRMMMEKDGGFGVFQNEIFKNTNDPANRLAFFPDGATPFHENSGYYRAQGEYDIGQTLPSSRNKYTKTPGLYSNYKPN